MEKLQDSIVWFWIGALSVAVCMFILIFTIPLLVNGTQNEPKTSAHILSPTIRSLQKEVAALSMDHHSAIARLSTESASTQAELTRTIEHANKVNKSIDEIGTAINKLNERITKLEKSEKNRMKRMNCAGGVCWQ